MATAALILGGCAQSSGGGGADLRAVQDVTRGAFDSIKQTVQPLFEKGQVRPVDRYCDSLEESYEVTDNVMRLLVASSVETLGTWQRTGYRITPQNEKELTRAVKEISKNYLWMPVAIEEQIGAQLQQQQPKGKVMERSQARRVRTVYERADKALAAAAKDYPKLPYQLKLVVLEDDAVNAEALPAGYLYVTRRAAADLGPDALRLVLGHEVAHVAKRHTSKQIQQRMVDVGLGVEMLKQVIQRPGQAVDQKVFGGWNVVGQMQGVFARYDQDQELQADACAIRGMVYAGLDPIKARQEYLRQRGAQTPAGTSGPSPARPSTSRPTGLAFSALTEHPDDAIRERFFIEATSHHRARAGQTTTQPPTPSSPAR